MAWLTGWNYRKSHVLSGSSDGAQTNYQIGIKVYYGSGTDGTETVDGITFGKVYCSSKCKTDFGDIRFTDEDGNNLDFFIKEQINSNYSIIWVSVNTIPASANTKTIYCYYGNAVATSATIQIAFASFEMFLLIIFIFFSPTLLFRMFLVAFYYGDKPFLRFKID